VSDIRPARVEDADALAALHAAAIGSGFLATLGPRFLGRLYRRMVRSQYAFVFVRVLDEGTESPVDGFVAIAIDTGRFYREFLGKDAVPAAVAAAPALLRSPKQVWETLRYGTAGSDDDLPRAEVLAIAVADRARGGGIGGALLRRALEELRARGIGSACVVTATDNVGALRMYERGGFHRHHRTEVHAGVTQEVLVWP
jgi:ribosomal protein S18 acetylase RimI-like enzyme